MIPYSVTNWFQIRIRDKGASSTTSTSFDLTSFIQASKNAIEPHKPHANLTLTTQEGFSIYRKRQRPIRNTKAVNMLGTLPQPDSLIIESDPAFQAYLDYLRQRGNNQNRLSNGTLYAARRGLIHFLHFCNIPITNHALTDLVDAKRMNPNNIQIEQALRKYMSIPPAIKTRTNQASLICGIFARGNFTPLHIHVNNHYDTEKEEIPESTLRAIYHESKPEAQVIQQIQASLGERQYAIGMIQEKDFELNLDDTYAIVYFDGEYTKDHIRHFSICFKDTALKAIEYHASH